MTQTPAVHPSHYDADVLVVGAGPSGLTLAAALAKGGVRAVVIDRQAEGANTSRAAVVHARTLEVLESLDVSRRLVARGIKARRFTVRDRDRVLMPIGFEDLPTRYPYTLMVSQAVTESVLLERFTELGGRVLRPRSLVDLHQDATGATVRLAWPGRSSKSPLRLCHRPLSLQSSRSQQTSNFPASGRNQAFSTWFKCPAHLTWA